MPSENPPLSSDIQYEASLDALEVLLDADPKSAQRKLLELDEILPSTINSLSLRRSTLACEINLALGLYLSAYEGSGAAMERHSSLNKERGFGGLSLCHGSAAEYTGHYQQAIELYNRTLDLAISLADLRLQAKSLRLRGDFYAFHGTVESALLDLQRSYRLSEQAKDDRAVFRAKNSLAILYSYMDEHQKAMEYYEEVYQYAKQNELPRPVAILTFNLGKAHHRLKNFEEAKRYFKESETLSENLNDVAGVAFAIRGHGIIAMERQNFDESKEKLSKAIALFKSMGSDMQVAQTKARLASLYQTIGDNRQSVEIYLSAIKVFEEKNSLYSLSSAYERLSKVYAMLGDYEKAYFSHQKYSDYHNQHKKLDRNKRIEELRIIFDTERAEAENKLLAENYKLSTAQLSKQKEISRFQTWIIALGLMLVISLIFQVRKNFQNKKRLELLVRTDDLTQLANRRHIMELIEREFQLALRGNSTLSLIIFDIDHFKNFNDEYGHKIGDKVLQAVANCCQLQVRNTDILGRIGGEEFLIFLPQTKQLEALEVAERCRAAVEKINLSTIKDKTSISISLGVASFTEYSTTVDDMLNEADIAMYQAKSQGRNLVRMSK